MLVDVSMICAKTLGSSGGLPLCRHVTPHCAFRIMFSPSVEFSSVISWYLSAIPGDVEWIGK